jgi:hypothetical protein
MVNRNSTTFQIFRKIGYIGGILIRYVATAMILQILRKKITGANILPPSPIIEASLKTNN